MTTLFGFDGATPWTNDADPTDRTRLRAVKSHGGVLVSVYIVGSPGGMRCANKRDVQAARALDLGVWPNWERGADYLVTCGHSGGITAGKEAAAACEALGIPHGTAVAFSWDTYIHPDHYPACGWVADGIIAGLAGRYEFSAYGQGGLIEFFRTTGRMKGKGWLSASTGFPGYDAASPHVGMVQQIGTPVPGTDRNVITDPHALGAWWPDNSPYLAAPTIGGTGVSKQDVFDFFNDPKGAALVKALVQDAVASTPVINSNGDKGDVEGMLRFIDRNVNADLKLDDPAALAALLVAKLPAPAAGGLTVADVETALRDVFAAAATPPATPPAAKA